MIINTWTLFRKRSYPICFGAWFSVTSKKAATHSGREQRDGIDLYYANVQLLSERDLQRRKGQFLHGLGEKIYSIYRNSKTRWFQKFFIFIPIPGEMIHVIRAYFSDGDSINHQAENFGHFSLDLLQINSHLGLQICLELKMSDLLCCRGPGAEAGGWVFECI